MIPTVTLPNGIKMPALGYGVFRMKDPLLCEEAVVQAIQCGYRLIDTAAAYENEEAVGRAIRRCGVPREELFVTTKLWITDTSYEGAKRGFARSMQRLGLEYLDLYLIHQPYNDYYGAWRTLEELYAAGKVRAIGVDNFTQDKLADLMYWNKVKPAVNLVECNAFFQREDDRLYMQSRNIQMQAWSPLAAGQGRLLENETLRAIAADHGKSVAQIVLRWLVQRNIVPLIKSGNPQRMQENLAVFDFSLTDAEMHRIAALDTGHTAFSPRSTGPAVEDFLRASSSYHV
ncbi:aldo/keto reductase [uncultured Gemmiger sp.]|uniref:aldo/keto reductase n=1 Tax=uncultured Gemmiger sp. TaxID=1623490 RepID=UPI0025CC28C7|nr:aldo/keto reductase [uncultured Gemmiger sp.]